MPAPIVSYWSGGPLDYIALSALHSFGQMGHSVTLWCHGDVPAHLPDRVTVCDAGELVDPATLPAENRDLLPDITRWEVLAHSPGAIFMPPDFVLLAPLDLPESGYLFGWESETHIAPAPVALPHDSPELTALRALAADPHPIPFWADAATRARLEAADPPVPAGHLPWGLLGATALTHMLRDSGRIAQAEPVEAFHPLPYATRALLLTRKRKIADVILPGTKALPLYGQALLHEIARDLAGLPRYWCPLGEVIRRAEIEPRAHLPADVVLVPTDDRWALKDLPKYAPPPALHRDERICVLTCMKNEGPFILEWIAHHRAIGVTDFIVYTNDCTDGTDTLLDLLVAKGLVTARFDNPYRPDTPGMSNPQFTAFEDAQKRPEMAQMDWVLPMDVDEYIDVKVGDGTLAALFAVVPDADTISLTWRLFGNDGCRDFQDVPVTSRMHRAAIPLCKKPYQALGFKTLHRNDGRWQEINVHRPKKPDPAYEDQIHWVSSSGKPMLPEFRDGGWRVTKPYAGYDLVSLNHYAVRDAESYLVKRDRGRVNHVSEDQGLKYWFRMNHNTLVVPTFTQLGAQITQERDALLADPQIQAAHESCVTAHRARIAQLHERPDMAALYAAITGPILERLSHQASEFGNRIFEAGPQFIPHPVLDWALHADKGEAFPAELSDPEAIDEAEADVNRLLPDGAPRFSEPLPEEVQDIPAEDPNRLIHTIDTPADTPDLEGRIQLSGDGEGVMRFRHLLRAKEDERLRTPNGDQILVGFEAQAAYDYVQNRRRKQADLLPPPPQAFAREKITAVTAMRNEAPFILEWIAWHRAIGVTDFLVYTNDCTDNTNAILDRLAEMGIVTRHDNPFNREAGQKPQRGALNHATAHPLVTGADWIIVTDVDEFITIHTGDGTIDALCAAMNEPNMIAMTWKFFGNSGINIYEDRPVTEQFVACAPFFLPKPRLGWGFKTMFHQSAPVDRLGVHRPLDMNLMRREDVRWVNGSGQVMPDALIEGNGWRSTKRTIGYDLVTLNHYILRSADSFLVKRERGRINHVEQDQGFNYWSTRNYGTEIDTRARRFMALKVAPVLAELKADPELARLHEEAVTWHRDRIAHLKAQPDYATLYEAITDPELADAILLAAGGNAIASPQNSADPKTEPSDDT